MKNITLKAQEVLICTECSEHYDRLAVIDECDKCKEPFYSETKIICSRDEGIITGGHYHEDCWSKIVKTDIESLRVKMNELEQKLMLI